MVERSEHFQSKITKGVQAAQWGILANTVLALIKIIAGLLGNAYALIADGIESFADIFSSLIVWRGLTISGRDADQDFHFGYGKAESMASAVVSLMLLGAGLAVAIAGIREILTPHHLPAPFTLVVLVLVVITKEYLYRRVSSISETIASTSVRSDALHHRSDAITSLAAFVGILIALVGGPGWESADDCAALFAAAVILWNGASLFRSAASDLMDRAPDPAVIAKIHTAAESIPGVSKVEKILARKSGLGLLVDMHVHANPEMSLFAAHELSGAVKHRVIAQVPIVLNVLIHMEPDSPERTAN